MSDTTIDKLDSSILKLKSLESEFDLVMTQYKQAYLDYINTLQTTASSTTTTTGQREFKSIQNSKFWGTVGLKETTVTSMDECKAMCAGDANCTGATFNSSSSYCWLRSGDGDVNVSDNPSEYALMPSMTQNTNNLKMLNDKLINLNIQIISALNESEPIVFDSIEHKDETKAQMQDTKQKLEDEREKIYKLLDQYDDLSSQYDSNSIYVRQMNASYIFWTSLAVIIIIIIVKLLITPQSRGSDTVKITFRLIFIFIFIIAITKMNTASGFAIFGVFIILILLRIFNILAKRGTNTTYGNTMNQRPY
jgi:hypothetical protein